MNKKKYLHLISKENNGYESSNTFASDLKMACRSRQPSISPKYLYDKAGSLLFDRICDLPEYYPTRTEIAILQNISRELAALMGAEAELVEFGAGSLVKTRILLNAMRSPSRFIAIDISGEHLLRSCQLLRHEYPSLDVVPVVADYSRPFVLPPPITGRSRRIGFFPGSCIGNFTPYEAHNFLCMAADVLSGGALVLGADLIKEPSILNAAYNDTQGVTAQFNLNLLVRANRELKTNFAVEKFSHYAFYNAPLQRMEMHLISRCQQTFRVLDEQFDIDEGDTIHTENSYKYTLKGVRRMALAAGFIPGPAWCDKDRLFSLHWLQAPSKN